MNKSESELIQEGAAYAYIDKKLKYLNDYTPTLLYNDKDHKIKTAIVSELLTCDEFMICVSFIRFSGIDSLIHQFDDTLKRGVKGRIITTDYLGFSEPKALSYILEHYPNIELKMYRTGDEGNVGFHTKGYIFRKGDKYDVIVGSSNLSDDALNINKEWNTKTINATDGAFLGEVISNFENLWDKSVPMKDWIENYTKIYKENDYRNVFKTGDFKIGNKILEPNSMQVSFITNLKKEIADGEHRSLLISATGTGKTYASAFALRDLDVKRVLYIAHRTRILKQSEKSYKKIFGDGYTTAIFNENSKDVEKVNCLFATIQTISKNEYLKKFDPKEFDFIVIDEVHKAGAKSYLKIMDYFKPDLFLGMTATPERTDGFDIFGLFDNNISCEIRLEEALKEDLLCPFHYFGITDFTYDGKEAGDNLEDFKFLVCDKRVDYILEMAEKYSFSGTKVHGLIFVSRKDEGQELSQKINERGYKTSFLSGDNSDEEREAAINKLSMNSGDYLNYIISVDIFNEGIDIPEINQVLLLRPTQSAIIFVQQLGRGLRKYENKDFVTVIDFIGNYANNYLIPIALSGNRGNDKDSIRKYISEGTSIIPGCSSVEFDKISKERIYKSLDSARINLYSLIKNEYKKVKSRMGRIPTLKELDTYSSIDVPTILDSNSVDSYYDFLIKNDKESFNISLSNVAAEMLKFVSKKLIKGKRIYDVLLLKNLIIHGDSGWDDFVSELRIDYKKILNSKIVNSIYNLLSNNFCVSQIAVKTFANAIFVKKDGEKLILSDSFKNELSDSNFKNMMLENINFAIDEYLLNYSNSYKDTDFVQEQKYSYEEVQLLLNWSKNINGLNIGGYKYDLETNTWPVFVNYDKNPDINESINYHDRFVSQTEFIAISKVNRTVLSKDAILLKNAKRDQTKIYLFIRKNKENIGEAKFFYFLGEVQLNGELIATKNQDNQDLFEIPYELDKPVSDGLYNYLANIKLD